MPPSRGIHRLAVATAASTFVLLFVGGLVTRTGSALAVPDWPLSFGRFFPPMVGGVLFEHGHRLAATLVGCLTLILALSIVVRESRPSVRALGLLALLAIVLQGILGGVTVLYKLPLAVSVAHACLGQTFLLGALVRHTGAGLAIPDFPLAFGRVVPPLVSPYITVHFAHRIGALVVAASVMATPAVAGRCHRGDGRLGRPALLALALLVLQITLGGVTVWSRRAVLATTTHLVVGAA